MPPFPKNATHSAEFQSPCAFLLGRGLRDVVGGGGAAIPNRTTREPHSVQREFLRQLLRGLAGRVSEDQLCPVPGHSKKGGPIWTMTCQFKTASTTVCCVIRRKAATDSKLRMRFSHCSVKTLCSAPWPADVGERGAEKGQGFVARDQNQGGALPFPPAAVTISPS